MPDLVLGTFANRALAGKTCIVTGAGSGMGRAVARRFAQAGARVVMADVRSDAVEATGRTFRDEGADLEPLAVTVDLTGVDACAALVEQAVAASGRLDAVVNCAGVGGMIGTVETHPLDAWKHALDTNLGSVFGVCRAAVPHLRAAGGGAIVNFASAAAYRGSAAVPSHAYAASKGGVIALTRVMAASYGRDRIRVNAIVPGLVRTAMTEAMMERAQR